MTSPCWRVMKREVTRVTWKQVDDMPKGAWIECHMSFLYGCQVSWLMRAPHIWTDDYHILWHFRAQGWYACRDGSPKWTTTVDLGWTCGRDLLTTGENILYENESEEVENIEAQIPDVNNVCPIWKDTWYLILNSGRKRFEWNQELRCWNSWSLDSWSK